MDAVGDAFGVTVRAPAKINLQLAVGPRGGNGYHEVVTVYHAVSLFDEVTVRPAERTEVSVKGEGAHAVPVGDDNLAARAASALAKAVGVTDSVALELRKQIPVAAGLAGGSADAAAALVACNELWHAGLGVGELREIAAEIGSDVPFALLGGTAVGLGRGERLSSALASGRYHWVLAFADGELSTASVYATCDRIRDARGARPPRPRLNEKLMAALRSGDPAALGEALENDLQAAALSMRPGLRRTLAAGRENGALGAIVSGSGPTCAFLAADAGDALDLAVALSGAGVCRTVVRAEGPAPGATVVEV